MVPVPTTEVSRPQTVNPPAIAQAAMIVKTVKHDDDPRDDLCETHTE